MTGTDLEDATGAPDDRSDVPPAVRSALVQAASDALGTFEAIEVPSSLRSVHRFAPRRRASAGAGPLWTALVQEDGFRSSVARVWAQANPELAAQVVDAEPEPSAQAAAGAWLLGVPSWRSLVPPDATAPDDAEVAQLRASARPGAGRRRPAARRADRRDAGRAFGAGAADRSAA